MRTGAMQHESNIQKHAKSQGILGGRTRNNFIEIKSRQAKCKLAEWNQTSKQKKRINVFITSSKEKSRRARPGLHTRAEKCSRSVRTSCHYRIDGNTRVVSCGGSSRVRRGSGVRAH